MIILQLDSEQLANIIRNSVRNVLEEQTLVSKTESDPYLTIKEAANFLNLAPQTIYGFTSMQKIPFLKKGKKLYFKKSELVKWISEGRKI